MASSFKRSYQVAFVIGTALVIGITITTTRQRSHRRSIVQSWLTENNRRLRKNVHELDQLECGLSLHEFIYDQKTFSSKSMYLCHPLEDGISADTGYEVDLNDEQQKEYQTIVDGGYDPVLTIMGGQVDTKNARIILSSQSQLTIENRMRRRRLLESKGRLTAMAVRVVLTDGTPIYSKDEIYDHLFTDTVSLKGQYMHCSFGKLIIEPSQAGVIEVQLPLSGRVTTQQAVVNAASEAALDYLYYNRYGTFSQLREYADMIIFITPEMGNWLAYGSVGGGVSVYNNKWGGFIASLMHETGHNFNLLHAFEKEEYLDYTGYMGGAILSYHDKVGFPSMCYNAANHWQLGWYEDRAIEVDLFAPTLVNLASFVDYPLTNAGQEYVLVRSGNVFMHYNLAKGINKDTYEYKDNLVIYQAITGGSYLFASLSYPDNPLYTKAFPEGTWHAEICDKVPARDSNTPDMIIISIGFGQSQCSQVKTTSNQVSTLSQEKQEIAAYVASYNAYHVGKPLEKNVKVIRSRDRVGK